MKNLGIMSKPANIKFVMDYAKKIGNESGSAFAKYTVGALCIKEAINGYYYYTQSLNNKEIPESKRKFVAALDLMNCLIMIATQLSLGMMASGKRCQSFLTGKLMGNLLKKKEVDLTREEAKNAVDYVKVIKENGVKKYKEIKYTVDTEKVTKLFNKIDKNLNIQHGHKFEKTAETIFAAARGGIGIGTTLLVTTLVGKRMLTPLVATPLAGWYKDKFLGGDQAQHKRHRPTLNGNNSVAYYRKVSRENLTRELKLKNNVVALYRELENNNSTKLTSLNSNNAIALYKIHKVDSPADKTNLNANNALALYRNKENNNEERG